VSYILDNTAADLPLIEIDRTPRFFVTGLARLVPMQGNTLLSYYVLHPRPGSIGGMERRLELDVILPTPAIAQAFNLAAQTLGPKAIFGENFSRILS